MKIYDKTDIMGMSNVKRGISRSILMGLYPALIDKEYVFFIPGINCSRSPWYDQNIEMFYNLDLDKGRYTIYEHKSFSYKSICVSGYASGFTHIKTRFHIKLGSFSSSRALLMSLKIIK
jgi:hypothetical protein